MTGEKKAILRELSIAVRGSCAHTTSEEEEIVPAKLNIEKDEIMGRMAGVKDELRAKVEGDLSNQSNPGE